MHMAKHTQRCQQPIAKGHTFDLSQDANLGLRVEDVGRFRV